MKLAIMQPYLFPYFGYFQLINAVDTFVIHDDVQYIKGGWINRNNFLDSSKSYLLTLSVAKDKYTKNINERYFADPFKENKENYLRKIKNSYRNAPNFSIISNLLRDIFSYEDNNVSSFIVNQLQVICTYLNIDTHICISSRLNKNNTLDGSERVVEINKVLNATHYINPIGGINLYQKEVFNKEGLTLNFLKSNVFSYKQYKNSFVPNLSIIDLLMFVEKDAIKNKLNDYELV